MCVHVDVAVDVDEDVDGVDVAVDGVDGVNDSDCS